MIRIELESQLENSKNNFILVLTTASLLNNPNCLQSIKDAIIKFGGFTFEPKQLLNAFSNPKDKGIFIKEFLNMGLRVFVKEDFELIKSYCYETNQQNIFTGWQYYHFSRMIRNCVSHNFKFSFSNYDLKLLPITWRHLTIDNSLSNQFLKLEFFAYQEGFQLHKDFVEFVKNNLL